jgi:hypothetical protein
VLLAGCHRGSSANGPRTAATDGRGCLLLTADETAFFLVEATSLDEVRAMNADARIPADRIAEAVEIGIVDLERGTSRRTTP